MPTCAACHAEIPAGLRWCPICHANLVDPAAGRLSSPARRLGAHCLDVGIALVDFLATFAVFAVGVSTDKDAMAGVGLLVAAALFLAYVGYTLSLFARGTTPGKNMLGMRVVREDGRPAGLGTMLVREWIGKAISGMLLSLGYLWILIDRDRQGWHDKLMGTYVVE